MGFWNGFQLFLEFMGFWVDFIGFHGILLGFGVESVNKHQDSIYDLKKHVYTPLHLYPIYKWWYQFILLWHWLFASYISTNICSPRSTFGGHPCPHFRLSSPPFKWKYVDALKITMLGFKSENNYQLSGKHFRKRSRISLLNSGVIAT